MSATATTNDLDLAEQVARIRRMQEETDKFAAEQRKLSEEALKLSAEAAKLRGDRWLAPLLVVVSLLGAAGGIVTVLHGLR
ncbi:MAG: hypothetical protein RQ966_15130 [Acetobacteraceae bacterium]|nr:hypothetical protein [Acetobacteraceae bacterium]